MLSSEFLRFDLKLETFNLKLVKKMIGAAMSEVKEGA